MNIEFRASDGHQLAAYLAKPNGEATEAIVVIQEIFGLNSHIRSVANGYARDGYLAIAPALFDRAERRVELAYQRSDIQRGFGIATKVGMEDAVRDVAAAVDYAATQVGMEHVGAVGFCWGGYRLLGWRPRG